MTDQRSHRRAPLRVALHYKEAAQGDFLIEYTQNVSEGGLFIETRDPLALGSRILLCFELPDTGRRIDVAGTVTWTNPYREAGENPNPGMGIRFEAISMEDREAIAQIIGTMVVLPGPPPAHAA